MKTLLMGILLALVLGIGYGIYLFTKRPPDTRAEKAAFEITAEELVKEFSTDEAAANTKFVDQVLVVSGTVVEIRTNGADASLTLLSSDPMSGVTCSFYPDEVARLRSVSQGMSVKIKGKCTGKLMDVVLNNCSLVN